MEFPAFVHSTDAPPIVAEHEVGRTVRSPGIVMVIWPLLAFVGKSLTVVNLMSSGQLVLIFLGHPLVSSAILV